MGDIADDFISDNEKGINREEEIKYYIVWKGRVPGIYINWDDCKAQVNKFTGARYKSFVCNYDEALRIYNEGLKNQSSEIVKTQLATPTTQTEKYIENSLAVDAACSSNPGPVEYRGVNVKTGKTIFSQGPFADGTNNVGEFLAIVHGLAMLKKAGSKAPVYSDSQTALTWVKNKKANTNLLKTVNNTKLFELIAKSENWLRNNTYENPVLKWQTREWGEIPADYQRKK